jgi:TPP-dependent pyruvate/acetoin dehydrogenase alpha subunit
MYKIKCKTYYDIMINQKEILSLYEKISISRIVDEKIIKHYPENLMRCPVHLSIGQEGVAAGISQALKKEDLMMSNHRSHSHYLAKGCDVKKMIFEIFLKKQGCCGGKGGSMHLIDLSKNFYGSTPIVASTIPIATGLSFASKILNEKRKITVIYFGDGAFESGNFHECLNFSSLHNLNILFVCENNKFSVYSPLKFRQNKKLSIYNLSKQYGIKSFKGDGNKPDEVYKIAKYARKLMVMKNQPILLEFDTYRYFEHCGSNEDDHLNYRDKKEIEFWKKKCPRKFVRKKYKKLTSYFDKIDKKIEAKVSKIFIAAKKAKLPTSKDLKENIYA